MFYGRIVNDNAPARNMIIAIRLSMPTLTEVMDRHPSCGDSSAPATGTVPVRELQILSVMGRSATARKILACGISDTDI